MRNSWQIPLNKYHDKFLTSITLASCPSIPPSSWQVSPWHPVKASHQHVKFEFVATFFCRNKKFKLSTICILEVIFFQKIVSPLVLVYLGKKVRRRNFHYDNEILIVKKSNWEVSHQLYVQESCQVSHQLYVQESCQVSPWHTMSKYHPNFMASITLASCPRSQAPDKYHPDIMFKYTPTLCSSITHIL